MMHSGNKSGHFSAVHWMIDQVLVTALSDGYFEVPVDQFITGIPLNDIEGAQALAHREKSNRIDINAYLIRVSDQRPILIDAGAGKGLVPSAGRLLESLNSIGISPRDVGTVLLTHLHGDHCGGLVDEGGRASFPNAEVAVASSEYHYWLDDVASGLDKGAIALTRAALAPYTGKLRLIQDGEVVPGVIALPLPGHTPGHTGFKVGSLFVCGDLLNVPAVQSVFPNSGVVTDVDSTLAVQTRTSFLQRAARENLLLAGMHIEFPGVVQAVANEGGFRLVPAAWANYQ